MLTFSDMCVDLIMTGSDVTPQFGQVEKLVDDYLLELGGSCNIFACQASALGLRTGVFGRVGKDVFGDLILDRLRERGVSTDRVQIDPALKTGIGVALCPAGDRAILTYMGTIDAVYPADVTDELLRSTRHLHHASYYLHRNLRPAVPGIFRRAKELGLTTSLDTNWDPEEQWGAELEMILPYTDVFFPNREEAFRISRTTTLDAAAAFYLGRGVKVLAVKGGSSGSWVYTPDRSIAREVTPVTRGDSVGAGDSYDAGFLAGWLRGLTLERCLDIATACGRSVAGARGGLAGQLHKEHLDLPSLAPGDGASTRHRQ